LEVVLKNLCAVLAVLGASGSALAKGGSEPVTLEQLQKVGDKVADCMNKADDACFGGLWADDGKIINPEAVVGEGKAGVVKVFHDDWAAFAKGTTNTIKMDSFRQVKPDVVFADATHHMVGAHGPDGKELPPQDFHLVILLEKKKGQWLAEEARPYPFVHPPPPSTANPGAAQGGK
jgi:uncharacterized protein (TIGR02246 family)